MLQRPKRASLLVVCEFHYQGGSDGDRPCKNSWLNALSEPLFNTSLTVDSPQISVCLLAYNSAGHIKTALESVLAQTYTDWEMLISDDASKDNTAEVVRPYLSDPRIRYVHHEKNLGQPGNWAYAFENTRAPIIATLHADDAWKPETLALFHEAFSNSEVDLAWGSWTRCTAAMEPMAHQPVPDDERSWSGPDILRHVFSSNCVLPSSSAFRRDVLRTAGLPHLDYGMLCDREWWVRVAAVSRMARSISQSIVLYRIHDASVTTNFTNDGRLIRELDDFRSRLPILLESIPDREEVIKNYDRELHDFYFRIAMSLQVEGHSQEARTRLKQAMQFRWGHPLSAKELVKYVLFHLGAPGRKMLARLHGKNQWIKASQKK